MKKKESKGPEFSKDGHVRPLLIWVFEIAVVLVLAAVVSIFFCQTIVMQEGGMEPTLATGDKVLINKVSYKLGEPERGDIVAFKKDAKQHSSMHVKRIIGLPGETVQIKDGLILINGETYMEKKDFQRSAIPDWQRHRSHWEKTNILYLETTGTTVRTAVLPRWKM